MFRYRRFQWSRVARSLGSLIIISWYLIVVGWEAPIVRASLMVVYSLGSQLLGRQYRPGLSLLWTVVFLVVTQPGWLTSLSFQLSVLATWAVIAVVPLLHRPGFLSILESADLLDFSVTSNSKSWLSAWFLSGGRVIKEGLVMSLGVQLVVSPLLLWQFGELPLLSLLANGTLGWLTTVIGLSGLALFLAQTVLGWCGPVMLVIALPTRLFIELFMTGLAVFGRFPATVINWHLPLWQLVLWYLGLGSWYRWQKRVVARNRQKGVTWEELVNQIK